jgi:hypothetical protein
LALNYLQNYFKLNRKSEETHFAMAAKRVGHAAIISSNSDCFCLIRSRVHDELPASRPVQPREETGASPAGRASRRGG